MLLVYGNCGIITTGCAVGDDTRRDGTVGTSSQPLVGRMGPWQLVKLLSEGNLTRVYHSRPADAPSNQRRGVRRQAPAQGVVARSAGDRSAAPRGVGRQPGVAPEPVAGALGEREGAAVLRRDAEARRREPRTDSHRTRSARRAGRAVDRAADGRCARPHCSMRPA